MDKSRAFFLRLIIVVVILTALFGMWRYRSVLSPALIQTYLANHPYAPLIFLLLHLVASLSFFVPRTAIAAAAGIVFGLWWGVLWALLGAMLGAWAAFAIARSLGQRLFEWRALPKLTKILDRFERGGWRAVWIVRLLPLPHSPINYAFGLTRISWLDYSIGSFFGILPSTFIFVSFGAAGSQAVAGHQTGWILPSVIGLGALALSFLIPKLIRQPDSAAN